MTKFDEYSKNVELVNCSYDANNFDPTAGYTCPYIDVEMNVYGTNVSFAHSQEYDNDSMFGGLIIHSNDNTVKNEVEKFLKDNAEDLRDLIEDSDEYHTAISKYDALYEKSINAREVSHDDNFDFEREYNDPRDFYEDDMIKITETGRDYGVAAIIENKTYDDLVIFAEGDFVLAQIEAGDSVELTIDQYEELKEFIEMDEMEVKTADEMEQDDKALVNKYKHGIDR